ncbi:MAG: hypothetical protein AAGF12_08725 [Myxococcota bacterium]
MNGAALRRGFGVWALLFVIFLPQTGAAEGRQEAEEDPEDAVDPLLISPFQWQELLRGELRPNGALTRGSLLVAPAFPLVAERHIAVTLLPSYRFDRLQANGITDSESLHRFELGTFIGVQISSAWALDIDLRAVYAGALDEHYSEGWYPNLRFAANWAISRDFTASISALWTRTGLGLIPVPLFGVYYHPEGVPLRIDALLPRYVEVAVPFGNAEVFVMGHWESHVWSLTNGEARGDLLTRQEIRAQLGVRARVFGPLAIEISGQWIPFQQIELGSRSSSPASLDDFSLTVNVVLDKVVARQAFLAP